MQREVGDGAGHRDGRVAEGRELGRRLGPDELELRFGVGGADAREDLRGEPERGVDVRPVDEVADEEELSLVADRIERLRWRLDAERDHGDRVHACERRQIVAVALGEDGDRIDRSHEPALEPVPREVVGVSKRAAGAERRLAHRRGCAACGRLVDDEDTRRPPAAKRGQVLTHHLVVDVDEVRPPFLAQLADARVALGDAPVRDPARPSSREPGEAPASRVARRDRGPRDRRHRFAALGDARIDRRFVLAAKADERDAVALREPPDQLRGDAAAAVRGLEARRVRREDQEPRRHAISRYSAS